MHARLSPACNSIIKLFNFWGDQKGMEHPKTCLRKWTSKTWPDQTKELLGPDFELEISSQSLY